MGSNTATSVDGHAAVGGVPNAGVRRAAYDAAHIVFGRRTIQLMWFDLLRLRARVRGGWRRDLTPTSTRLHLGCGGRRVSGWLNVDVAASDFDVDLTSRLPWRAGSFDAIVSQHFIEHLELFSELLPLFQELRRVLRPGGEIWLSCPDMEKVCRSYLDGRVTELVNDRGGRGDLSHSAEGAPPPQIVNDLFHQWGEHKNLFDYELLEWALANSGFTEIRKVDEAALLQRFADFPVRHDDGHTLYVSARAGTSHQ